MMHVGVAHSRQALCYLCGRFTASARSLEHHLPKCREKWLNDMSATPPIRHTPPPKQPEHLPVIPLSPGPLLEAWNRGAALVFLQRTQSACPQCHRTFDTTAKTRRHMQRCCPELLPEEEDARGAGDGARVGNAVLVDEVTWQCPVCGENHGSKQERQMHMHGCCPEVKCALDVARPCL